MSLKRIKLVAVLGIFLISFGAHFIYDLFPNVLFSFFFPINESIFEHMKIIFTSTLLYGIIDYFLLRKNNVTFNNFSFQLFFSAISSIVIFLLIFLPIHYLFGESLIVTLIILFITYIFSQIISYILLKHPDLGILNKLSLVLIILVYINFIVLTYTSDKDDFFYDTYSNSSYILNE